MAMIDATRARLLIGIDRWQVIVEVHAARRRQVPAQQRRVCGEHGGDGKRALCDEQQTNGNLPFVELRDGQVSIRELGGLHQLLEEGEHLIAKYNAIVGLVVVAGGRQSILQEQLMLRIVQHRTRGIKRE